MADKEKSPERQPPRDQASRDSRAERLAAALRANLKRRKAQARGRAEVGSAQDAGKPPPPREAGE